MTQDTIRRGSVGTKMRGSPRAVETNGIGKCVGLPPQPDALVGRPPGPLEPAKTPYAGSSSRLLPPTQFMRLRAADGRWLHVSGDGLTLVKADSWIGTAPQLFKLREQHPDLNSMTVSAP